MVKKLLFYKIFFFLFFLFSGTTEALAECADAGTTVSISTNSENQICEGNTLSFTGNLNPSNPSGAVGYQWQVKIGNGTWNDISGATSKDLTSHTPSIGSNRFRLLVTLCNGTSDATQIQSTASGIIDVYPVLSGKVTIQASSTTICPDTEVVFSITSITSHGGSSATYQWYNKGILIAGETSNVLSIKPADGDEISLEVNSSIPCVDNFFSNPIPIINKPGKPDLPGEISGISTPTCPNTEVNLSIPSVDGADSDGYIWTLPTGWTFVGASNSNSVTVKTGPVATHVRIKVNASNECGPSAEQELMVDVGPGDPVQPGAITAAIPNGGTAFCLGSQVEFEVGAVAGVTKYNWSVPSGWTIMTNSDTDSDPNRISVTVGAYGQDGNVEVNFTNACSTGPARSLPVQVAPPAPVTIDITGEATVCRFAPVEYSVPLDENVETYTWTAPSGWTLTPNGNKLTAVPGETAVDGNISIEAKNSCGKVTDIFPVTLKADIPVAPVISGDILVCSFQGEEHEVVYTIGSVIGAEIYHWKFPTGWIIEGANSNILSANQTSVTVNPGNTAGEISVSAENSCGKGVAGILAVDIAPPAPEMPGEIQFGNGANAVCKGKSSLFYFSPVPDATSYLWTLPDGTTTTTDTSELNYTANVSGNQDLKVEAVNSCGHSTPRDFQIKVADGIPAVPGEITSPELDSNPNICPPLNGITFSVPADGEDIQYLWGLPPGWDIISGEGTNSITVNVTANAPYDQENVTVKAKNICGESEASVYDEIITVSDFIVTNIGPDKTVCRVLTPISIDVEMRFGNSKKLIPNFASSGSGTFDGVPKASGSGNNNIPNNFTIKYLPSQEDIENESVTLTFTVPVPNGENPCGPGKDEMVISFQNFPEASIEVESPICFGGSSEILFTGSPNSTVTYEIAGVQAEIVLGSGTNGVATEGVVLTGLEANTSVSLISAQFNDPNLTCSTPITGSAEILVTPIPDIDISYGNSPYCSSIASEVAITEINGVGAWEDGDYKATGSLGENIDTIDGSFIPQSIDPGTYTVTYTIPPSLGCEAVEVSTEVTITAQPTVSISYPGSPICSNSGPVEVVLAGTGNYQGGEYSAADVLKIDPVSGTIDPANSTPGTYTISYSTVEAGGCDSVTATTEVIITENPSPVISFDQTSFCSSDTATYTANITGSGAVSDGEFSATGGLSITADGVLSPSESPVGTYTVIYTTNEGGGCDPISVETEIIITEEPYTVISYSGPFCQSISSEKTVSFTNTVGDISKGTFSAEPAGLSIDQNTGAITPSESEIKDYSITLSVPAEGGCGILEFTTELSITEVPMAMISYNGPFCSSDSALKPVSFSDTSGEYTMNATFSGTNGLIINEISGEITPSVSSPGIHIVTYTIPTQDGCAPVEVTAEVEILKQPDITSQPIGLGICSGENVLFEVVAIGDNLTYKWFKNGSIIEGETSTKLVLPGVTADDNGDYHVEITGSSSCTTVPSDVATLTVDENIIVNTPPKDENICINGSVTFSVDAELLGEGELKYQWRFNGTDITDATDPTYTIPEVTVENAGSYDVLLEGPNGYSCSSIITAAGHLTVITPPIVEAGEDFSICYSSGSINIAGETTAVSGQSYFEWKVLNGAEGGVLNNPDDLMGATYTPVSSDFNQTLQFQLSAGVEVDGVVICEEVVKTKNITIIPEPKITSFTYADVEFCETDIDFKTPLITGEHFTGGIFKVTANPSEALLGIDEDGIINPSESDLGTYEIIYSIPANDFCEEIESEPFTIKIGKQPDAVFQYADGATVFCRDTRAETDLLLSPIFTETGHENFDDFEYVLTSPEGNLVMDDEGVINLTQSSAGEYAVTRKIDYTGSDLSGCAPVTETVNISISDMPIADFSYEAIEFCSNPNTPKTITPVLAENGQIGEFESTAETEGANLIINSTTGEIDVAKSDEGSYTITNTISPSGEDDPCSEVNYSFEISITKLGDPIFSYGEFNHCISARGASVVEGFTPGGTFSTESTLVTVDPETGALNWSVSEEGVAGTHTITYTLPTNGPCGEISATVDITIDALPIGGTLAFGDNGRVFMTCENAIPGYGDILSLQGHAGTVVAWEYRNSETLIWNTYDSTKESLSSTEVESLVNGDSEGPQLTTIFRAILSNGACDSGVYSGTAIVSVIPTNIEPAPVQVDPIVLCYGDEINLSSETGYGHEFGQFENGDFDNAGIKNQEWRFTNPDGTPNDFSTKASNGRADHWLRMVPHGNVDNPNGKVYTANLENPTQGSLVNWDPSIDNQGNEGFAIVTGDNDSYMETPSFSLNGMDAAIITWDQGYNLTNGARIRVEISTNGGSDYDTIPLFEVFGTATSGYYDGFGDDSPGDRSKNKITLDLGEYLGQTDLRIRFSYEGAIDGDVWAVDNIKVPDGPAGVKLEWFYDSDVTDPNNTLEQIGQTNQEQVTFTPRKIGWNDFEVKTALLLDSNGNACESLENSKNVKVFVYDQYRTSVNINVGSCGDFSAELSATVSGDFQGPITEYPTLDGYFGRWKITDDAGNPISLDGKLEKTDPASVFELAINDPNVIFTAEDLDSYNFSYELVPNGTTAVYPDDFFVEDLQGETFENPNCDPISPPTTEELLACTTLDFDGVDDYVDLGTGYTDSYSIEAWIRPFDRPVEGPITNASVGTIISGPGFEISMDDLSGVVEKNGRWYHIATIGSKIYVDGVPTSATVSTGGYDRTLIGARWNSTNNEAENYFSGWIEEVRVWKIQLTVEEIHMMMNQRLAIVTDPWTNSPSAGTPVDGEVVPIRNAMSYFQDGAKYNLYAAGGPRWYDRTWDDLAGYFRLISEVPDPDKNIVTNEYGPLNGNTPNFADATNHGHLHNMETHQQNTSPVPYISGADGDWSNSGTWLRPTVWDFPNSTSQGDSITWNIAQTHHNILSGDRNITLLGLLVEENELTIMDPNTTTLHWENNGKELRITHYLKLNGVIDMYGSSQLLQNSGSIIDSESTGSLEIDQQGTLNSYNYNYWTSPVSLGPRIGEGDKSEHVPYMIQPVLKDGTYEDFKEINFNSDHTWADGGVKDPIHISSYWLYKFHGDPNVYGQWRYVGPGIVDNGLSYLKVGEGWSMKGSRGGVAVEDRQNYTFRGMPNNGDFSLYMGPNQNYLVGNPFPSAIDANVFIDDNAILTGGVIYFWSHFKQRDSHILKEYEGGYAPYTKLGGTRPYANDERIDNTGALGDLKPERFIPIAQAFFIRTDSTEVGGDIEFKNSQRFFQREEPLTSVFLQKEEKKKTERFTESRERIWINFRSPAGVFRNLLVTADENTTDGFDLGYDAPLKENFKEDMYWVADESKFVIQGVPDLKADRILPLGVKTQTEGWISIEIDELQNIPDNKPIYIKDNQVPLVHDLRESPYVVYYNGGLSETRFELVFRNELAQISEPPSPEIAVNVQYLTSTKELVVYNPHIVELFHGVMNNVLGQKVQEFGNIPDQEEVRLQVKTFSPGVYVIKLRTEAGMLTEKIIIEE